MQKNKKNLQPLLDQAQKLFRHCRQGSYKTRERYFAAFKRFLIYLADTYGLQKIANVNSRHLSAYVLYMQQNGLSASTIKTDLAAIRFWHDLVPRTKHKLPDNNAFDLEQRVYRGIDRTWTEEEFAHMVSSASEQGRSDYAAAMFLGRYLGLRIHEAFKIDAAMARAALKCGFLTVRGKGGKVRQVPNHPESDRVLRELLDSTSPGQKLLLPPDKSTHIAVKELQQFIADYRLPRPGEALEQKTTYHGLRHMFAVEAQRRLLASGVSAKMARLQVSRWTGHEREEIMNVYSASLQLLD